MRFRPALLVCVTTVSLLGTTAAVAAPGLPGPGTDDPPTVPVHFSGRITAAASGNGVAGMCVAAVYISRYSDAIASGTTNNNGDYTIDFNRPEGEQSTYAIVASPFCGAEGWWRGTSYPSWLT